MTPDSAYSLDGRTILIAEDEAMIAMWAESIVEELGGRVSCVAPTCEAALAALDAGRIDLVLLDVNLSGGTSERVVDAAAELGIPVLVSSGSGQFALPPKFQNLPLLSKPWNSGDLIRALALAFGEDPSIEQQATCQGPAELR